MQKMLTSKQKKEEQKDKGKKKVHLFLPIATPSRASSCPGDADTVVLREILFHTSNWAIDPRPQGVPTRSRRSKARSGPSKMLVYTTRLRKLAQLHTDSREDRANR